MTSGAARRPRGEATRAALIAAALTIVERDGIAAATTRQIADEAGVPLGTVHYWFASKADLLREVATQLLGQVRADATRSDPASTVGSRLADVYASYMAMDAGRQLALFELTTHSVRNDELDGLAREQYETYRSAAREAIEPWAASVDARLPGGSPALAALLVAVMDGVTLAGLADPQSPAPAEALRLFAGLLENAGVK